MKAESDDDIIAFNRTVRKSAKSLLGMQALVVELVSRTEPITREHLTNLASELLDCYKLISQSKHCGTAESSWKNSRDALKASLLRHFPCRRCLFMPDIWYQNASRPVSALIPVGSAAPVSALILLSREDLSI
jgi:hypothetical protein